MLGVFMAASVTSAASRKKPTATARKCCVSNSRNGTSPQRSAVRASVTMENARLQRMSEMLAAITASLQSSNTHSEQFESEPPLNVLPLPVPFLFIGSFAVVAFLVQQEGKWSRFWNFSSNAGK